MPKQVGLSARLQFLTKGAIAGMRKAHTAFGKLNRQVGHVKSGVANISRGFSGLTLAGVGLGAAVVGSVKKFADFGFQMAKVTSLTSDASGKTAEAAKNQKLLEQFAKQQGATTRFTAVQAAEAMENLARAGLNTKEIIKALPQVLQLATAENMNLARATQIVTDTANQFGLGMDQAAKITNVMAFVSKNTTTNVDQLFEGLKFAGTTAKGVGATMKDTTAILGLLANIGVKAGQSGAALNNALIKLGQNAKRGSVRVGRVRVEIAKFTKDTGDAKKGQIDLVTTFQNIFKATAAMKTPLQRQAALMKLLGIRGGRAGNAIGAAFSNPERTKKTLAFLNGLRKNLDGTTKKLADAQRNTALGQWVEFKSAIEGVQIEFGKLVGTMGLPALKNFKDVIGDAATAMSLLANPTEKNKQELQKLNQTGVGVAKGLREGFKAAKEVFAGFGSVIKTVGGLLGVNMGKNQTSSIITLTAKTVAWGIALKGVVGIFGRMASVAKGSFQIIRGGLGILGGAAKGILGPLASRFAGTSKVLSGLGGVFSKTLGAAEKLTAMPVRVVNFDEMGGAGGVATAAGGAGTAAAGGAAAAAGILASGAIVGALTARFSPGQQVLEQLQKKAALERSRREGAAGLIGAARSLSGKNVSRTQALAALQARATKRGDLQQFIDQLPRLLQILSTLPESVKQGVEKANIKNNVSVKVNSREVGKAAAKADNETKERTGKLPAGARGAAARK